MEVGVSRIYLKRGFKLENIPVLLQKAIAEFEEIGKYCGTSDLSPANDLIENR